jgi:hypothetical protein
VLDLGTYVTGTQEILSFIRNSTYTLHTSTEVVGFKRIVGSFTEASAFSGVSLTAFALCVTLRLGGVYPRLTGTVALLSLAGVVFSTSTTGYAGLVGFLIIFYCMCVLRVLRGRVSTALLVFLMTAPIFGTALTLALMLHAPTWTVIQDVLEATVYTKATSDSAIERGSWNQQAMRNFFDSYGAGLGIGSGRASSFPIAVLASVGVFGAITYGAFIATVLFKRRPPGADLFAEACRRAARAACIASLIAACLSGTLIDLGLPFFTFAGLAFASPELYRRRSAAPARGPVEIEGTGVPAEARAGA